MTFLFESDKKRGGTSATRSNSERFFHIMNVGWFVFTREADEIQNLRGKFLRDGGVGPFMTQQDAKTFLKEHITRNKSDKQAESWRYE